MIIKQYHVGEKVPDGAKFLSKKTIRGKYLETNKTIHSKNLFGYVTRLEDIYEQVEVYVYEIPDSEKTEK